MATTVSLRKILDQKSWQMCAVTPWAGIDSYLCASTQWDQFVLVINPNSASYLAWLYDPKEDAIQSLGGAGTQSYYASTNLAYHPSGPTGTASAGSATTITTTLTIPVGIAGYTIRITGGTGAGQERVISANTYTANSVITVTTPWTVNPDNTSTYLLLTGRFWILTTGAASGFYYYDIALNTWTGVSVSGVSAAQGLTATPAWGNVVASGTATAGSATTLENSAKTWTTNQWANSQVRITAGTGAGKVAVITSNTATTLTFPTVTTVLDNTSQYVIEPDDDKLYAGNATSTYKYSRSANTWSTISPGVARTSNLANGSNFNNGSFFNFVTTTSYPTWADESNIKNCRYIYSMAGGTNPAFGIYDIALNTWVNIAGTDAALGRRGVASSVALGHFYPIGGWSSCYDGRDYIYYMPYTSGNTPAMAYKFNIPANTIEPWTQWNISSTATGGGNGTYGGKLAVVSYVDGGTTIKWVYFKHCNVNDTFYRQLII